ncbi:hypothetical protein AXE80_03820 [Wenyingzhuangia fucanilytica]|uniref:Right handed beta helix domain-containing protein n=1 Tax=Wenyingzhuangia fucanilytica TaxID=1790137 RepID=A0A1B1Y3Y7_9FLAO|nr:hypothetical protein [Wenyingzhuangia fucanilytica]ANW95459.1 hypothetical protein AXE80_03820 [Wenyingzhuangia fucanilytica]
MKLSSFIKIVLIFLAICQFSCRKDFSTVNSNGNLSFSTDTLFLDTVFNDLSTTTKILKVYNRSKNDLIIPKIKLENNNSKYRMNIDGIPGTEFENVLLLKKDSLFVFVEGTISATDTNAEMIYEDKILFDPNGNLQKVNLVTLVKDAIFLFDSNNNDFEITETNFTNTKPYVIYGNAIVPENGSLTIEEGSTIHFSKNSSLTISQGATLNINGTLNDSIVFKSNNLNYEYDQIPGQWQGININNANVVNINYLKILNPTTGLNINNNTNLINIKNTEIYNAAENGILTANANITGENIVIGQAGRSSLYLQGGDYTFKHSTFANYWNKSIKSESTVSLANYFIDNTESEIKIPLNSANFINCIIAGTKNSELFLDKNEEEPIFNFNIKNSLLDLEKGDDLYNTDNSTYYTNALLNKKLDFRNTTINDLRIGLDNEGINQADITTATEVPFDIIGTGRTTAPDIGAYQHIDFKTLDTEDE